ncbi:MAG TPA: VWA domain-containing protein [Thermoanaerobaculia bacterium]|nr:VWA domain-containing protein [Thermoanaerobaculia bacterium]
MRQWRSSWISLALVAVATLLVSASPRIGGPRGNQDLPRVGGESIEVSIVNLDVFVNDKKGNRIHGLTKDDFEVFEDGKLQPITNFSEYGPVAEGEKVSVEGGATHVAEPAIDSSRSQRRTVIVFVDRMRLNRHQAEPVFDNLRALIHKAIRPGDGALVATWAGYRMHVVEPFTDDVQKLDTALGKLERATQQINTDSTMADVARELEWRDEVDQMAQLHNASPSGDNRLTLASREAAERAFAEMKSKTSAINALIASISGVEGKKVFLLATHRLSQVAGLEYIKFSAGPKSVDEIAYDTSKYVESIARSANANGVTIYPLYPEGIGDFSVTTPDQAQATISNQDMTTRDYLVLNNEVPSLELIAKRTGGMMAWNAKDIVALLPRVTDDFEDYYSLAYRMTTHNQDRERRLVVKTKNSDYVVRSRHAFVERSEETRMKDRVIANLFNEPDASVLHISTAVGKMVKKSKDRYAIPLSIRIPVGGLATVPQGAIQAGAFSVIVASAGIAGDVSDVTRRTQQFTIPSRKYEDAKTTYFTYDVEILADSRTDLVSIAVLDEVSKDYGFNRVRLPPRGAAPAGTR